MKQLYVLALAATIVAPTLSAKHHHHHCGECQKPANLIELAKGCNYDPMKHALKHGSFSQDDKDQAVMTAMDCRGKDVAYYLVKLLLKHNAQATCSKAGCPLNKAAHELHNKDIAELLIKYGAADKNC